MLAAENAIVPNTNFSIWTENNIYVNMVQLSSISEQDYGNFYGKHMSHEIWDALHHAYEPTTLSCIFGSLRKRRCLLILTAIGHHLWLQPGYLIRANSHVSHDLSNLDFSKAYQGPNTLHVRNGKGLPIPHVGSSNIHSPYKHFHLSNILHVPFISKNLLYVQKRIALIITTTLNFMFISFL